MKASCVLLFASLASACSATNAPTAPAPTAPPMVCGEGIGIGMTPGEHDFGVQVIATPPFAETTFTVTTAACGKVPMPEVIATVNFVVVGNTCTNMERTSSCLVKVSFAPLTPGIHTGFLTVTTNFGGQASALLAGEGVRRPSPDASVDGRTVEAGADAAASDALAGQ